MPRTLEDLDRRVTALELAQSARSESAIARIEQKVDALHRVTAELIAESERRMRGVTAELIAESEQRMRGVTAELIAESQQRMRAETQRIWAETQRILTVVNAAEQRTAGLINDSEQRILVALDRLKNP